MQASDTILAQIEVLRQELLRTRKAVETAAIDADLRNRVKVRFDTELRQLDSRNTALKTKVTQGQPPAACWSELRQLQVDAGKIFDEALAFMQGALARKEGLDDGICSLTDALLDELAASTGVNWGRFTLLATGELFRDIAELIRIRYPEVSLWSMPLAAHEFGHFIGPELRRREDGSSIYPFQDLLAELDETRPAGQAHARDWYHHQEYFADVYATYTLGPAYAAAFILLRLNPGEAHQVTQSHPSSAARVHGIFWTLNKMNTLEATRAKEPFSGIANILRDMWCESLRNAGQPEKLADAEASNVENKVSTLFDLLSGTTADELALKRPDWLRIEALSNELAPAALPAGLTRRDVLNAAWLARLNADDQSPYFLNDLVRDAMTTYRRI